MGGVSPAKGWWVSPAGGVGGGSVQPGGGGWVSPTGGGQSSRGGGLVQPGGGSVQPEGGSVQLGGSVSQGGHLGGGPAKIGQQNKYSLHSGRYASCVHTGGLSCLASISI